MAATSSGAIKAYVEAGGFGLAVFRERPAADAPLPYVTVQDGISVTPEPDEGRGGKRNGMMRGVREQVQVSLWMRLLRDGTFPGEDYLLNDRLCDYLDGCQLAAAPTAVFGVTVDQTVRQPDPTPNIVQYANTLTIRRERVPR